MFKAFSGALSLALTLVVLHWLLPGVFVLVAEVITKILIIISAALDQVQNIPR